MTKDEGHIIELLESIEHAVVMMGHKVCNAEVEEPKVTLKEDAVRPCFNELAYFAFCRTQCDGNPNLTFKN